MVFGASLLVLEPRLVSGANNTATHQKESAASVFEIALTLALTRGKLHHTKAQGK